MGRPKTVYRGRRKYTWLITLVLFVLAFIIIGLVWLFDYLQRYVVYEKDGLSIMLPYMREDDDPFAARVEDDLYDFDRPVVDAEIVVDEAGFDDLQLGVGENLTPVRARYVPAPSVTGAQLTYLAASLAGEGQNALMLQLKTSNGHLSYKSGVGLPDSYGVNGEEDISQAVAQIAGQEEIYLVAEIATLIDDAMALRNLPLALKDSRGQVITEGGGSWLDPYNRGTRQYITDIMGELAAMGFDEVVLTGIAHPRAEDIVYSQEMTNAPSIASSVSTFALRMCEAAHELGMKCSVMCQTAELRMGNGAEIGQSPELLFSLFDRVYVLTDSEHITADITALSTAPGADGAERIVPMVIGWTPERSSYAVQ